MIRSALVTSVYALLEEEKRAHARTKQQADAEIFRLRAMVARRDAELEACVLHGDRHASLLSQYSQSSHFYDRPSAIHGNAHPVDCSPNSIHLPYTRQQGSVLAQALVRQRTLEQEINFLHAQVQR